MDPRLRGGDAAGRGDTAGAVEPFPNVVIPTKAGFHESFNEADLPEPNPENRIPAPESRVPTVQDLAQLLWDSATLPRRRAEEEAGLLADYLRDYAARLASSKPDDVSGRRGVAAKILKLFREVEDSQRYSVSASRRARLALHDIAVAHFGKRPEFEGLVYPHDRFDQHRSEFFDLYFAEFDG